MSKRRLAFVVPRYGEQILGGAEALARGFAENIIAAGLANVEILTTCAIDHHTFANELPVGDSSFNGVLVRRFPIDHSRRDVAQYNALHQKLLHYGVLSRNEQWAWLDHATHSPLLYSFLDQHQRDFDLVFFIPYLFGTTFYASAIVPRRSILWPCLHDESYAYLDITKDLFRTCRGIMFNSEPEQQLAESLYGALPGGNVVGFGLNLPPPITRSETFLARHKLHDPYLLYSGRLESPKNVDLLIDYFLAFRRQHPQLPPIKLVLMGTGPVRIPNHPDIVSVGFMQGLDKQNIYAGASILCQPSVNESFSIVIMEAWQYGVPVMVHTYCDVTRHHVIRSKGGIHFANQAEFSTALALLLTDTPLRKALGQNGQRYVATQYDWATVLERFDQSLQRWLN